MAMIFDQLRGALLPRAVVIVTSTKGEGKKQQVGATTISWTAVVASQPYSIAVSLLPDSFLRSCILESREFIVHVPSGDQWEIADTLGSISGRWEKKSAVVRKNLGLTLTLHKSQMRPEPFRTPYIENLPVRFECRLMQVVQIGLYDLMIGQVNCMHCKEDLFLADHPRGNLDFNQFRPLYCQGDQYWSGGVFLGTTRENKSHPHGRRH